MTFTIISSIFKMYNEEECKLTYYSDENEDQLVVLTQASAEYFNKINFGQKYDLDQCISDFVNEYPQFYKRDVTSLFQDIIRSLREVGFLES